MKIKAILSAIGAYFAPSRCAICQEPLQYSERMLCTRCATLLPVYTPEDICNNSVARLFWGVVPVAHGTVLFHYDSSSPHHRLLVLMKYGQRPDLCRYMGSMLATRYLSTDFFSGIDLIVPVPLSHQRQKHRGYNQSNEIAQGISKVTKIPVAEKSVIRPIDNPTQTHLSREARLSNVKGVFAVAEPEKLEGKHILLVDDVITTGATIKELASSIYDATPTCTFSMIAVGLGGIVRPV